MKLPQQADVVIIGAGLAGAATAFALKRIGLRALVLEARSQPGLEASGRNAGMIRSSSEHPAMAELSRRAAALHASGCLSPFLRTGAFFIGEGDEHAEQYLPFASGRGRFFPEDGIVDAGALLALMLEDIEVRCDVRVERISPRSGALVVLTAEGTVTARVVVNAAGAWAGAFGDLPLRPLKRHLIPVMREDVSATWPIVWDLGAGLYVRPERGGLLACACDETEAEPGDNEVAPGIGSMLLDKAERVMPGLLPLRMREGWAGQRTFAEDRLPVVGWDARTPGLFWMAGLGGSGVTLSPLLGGIAARMILEGPSAPMSPLALPLSPSRFQ